MKILILAALATLLTACASIPGSGSGLSPEGQVALDISVRIAVRHALADSPRALEKAQNIRRVVARLQTVITAESTLSALTAEVSAEVDKLGLAPLDRADAQDLLTLLSVALESRLGQDALQAQGLVRVSAFLDLILAELPA
jgi:predicted small secreted protein